MFFTIKHLHLHEFKHLEIAQLDYMTVKLLGLHGLVCQWFDAIEVHDPKVAQLLCKMIPAHCPFKREIKLFDYILFRIPSLCQLNPLYVLQPAIRNAPTSNKDRLQPGLIATRGVV
jgi:hypothetical protein